VFEAGDAFYVPEGHNPLVEAGTEYVQFSRSNELHAVSDVMTRTPKRWAWDRWTPPRAPYSR
jgi:hypothetical protein